MKKENLSEQDCVFCSIAKGDIPSEDIYEDDYTKAFLDINPVTYGHTLVIPKEHFSMMTDVPDETLARSYQISKRLMSTLKKAYSADFVTLAVVGIDIPHFHIHLIPRKRDDGVTNFWPTTKYGEGELKIEANKIRPFVS